MVWDPLDDELDSVALLDADPLDAPSVPLAVVARLLEAIPELELERVLPEEVDEPLVLLLDPVALGAAQAPAWQVKLLQQSASF